MTPPASTEPMHCEYECVCRYYYEGKRSGSAEPCDKSCHHDTRARGPVAQQAPAIAIRMRFPLRDLLTVESAKWQEGYRERLIKQIIDGEKISTSEEWHEYFKSISKTCPSCFCPNLEEHYSDQYNSKGFHCPACGNSFSLPIHQYSLVDDAALIAQEREKWERERDAEELAPFVKRKMAQAREDVLKALRTAFSHVKADDCFGEMNSDKCHSYNDNGECFLCAFDSIAESLRSEVGK